MNLLLVDGSNIVMRAAFGTEIPPAQAVPVATGLIRRAVAEAEASHLIVTLDCPQTPSWRKTLCPEYKAHRTVDTSPWLLAAHAAWTQLGWYVEALAGYEADDVLATLAHRAKDRARVIVCSGDSDLLTLADSAGARAKILKPVNGGGFAFVTPVDICARYQIASPSRLRDLKSLMGEKGDNIAGVPGIGPVKAAKLLAQYGSVMAVLSAGLQAASKETILCQQHRPVVQLAYELAGLKTDCPILPIKPADCRYVAP